MCIEAQFSMKMGSKISNRIWLISLYILDIIRRIQRIGRHVLTFANIQEFKVNTAPFVKISKVLLKIDLRIIRAEDEPNVIRVHQHTAVIYYTW